MGNKFKKARDVIADNAQIVRTTLRSATALFLHGNPQYADEFVKYISPVIEMLKSEEIDAEDVLHKEIEKAFNNITQDKPIYVRAAISDLLSTLFMLATRKIDFDEDLILSSSERNAWIAILEGIVSIAQMVQSEESGKTKKK